MSFTWQVMCACPFPLHIILPKLHLLLFPNLLIRLSPGLSLRCEVGAPQAAARGDIHPADRRAGEEGWAWQTVPATSSNRFLSYMAS